MAWPSQLDIPHEYPLGINSTLLSSKDPFENEKYTSETQLKMTTYHSQFYLSSEGP